MSFSKRAELVALAIIHIFETSKPFGKFDAYVVLPDGAGVSYGVSQFTHRAGSLFAVVQSYLRRGGSVGASYFKQILPVLKQTGPGAVSQLSKDKQFKHFLELAAETDEMHAAQVEVASERYLQPAIDACEGSRFTTPMALAVIYDSKNQGSFEKIRDRVRIAKGAYKSDLEFEKAWITQYVQKRDEWLENFESANKKKQAVIRSTDYRTDFFLAQIARGNWDLNLPMNVHGYRLNEKDFAISDNLEAAEDKTAEPIPVNVSQSETISSSPSDQSARQSESNEVQPPQAAEVASSTSPVPVAQAEPAKDPKDDSILDKAEEKITWLSGKIMAIPAAILSAIGGAIAWAAQAPPALTLGFFGASAIIISVYLSWFMWLKNKREQRAAAQIADETKLKLQREQQAHEITLYQMKSVAEKDLQAVTVVPQPIQNSDSVEGAKETK